MFHVLLALLALSKRPSYELVSASWPPGLPANPVATIKWYERQAGALRIKRTIRVPVGRPLWHSVFAVTTDCSKVAFTGSKERHDLLCIVDEHGHQTIIPGRFMAAWSPSGRLLALQSGNGVREDVTIRRASDLQVVATLKASGATWITGDSLAYWLWVNPYQYLHPTYGLWNPAGQQSQAAGIHDRIAQIIALARASGTFGGMVINHLPMLSGPGWPVTSGFAASRDLSSVFCWFLDVVDKPSSFSDIGEIDEDGLLSHGRLSVEFDRPDYPLAAAFSADCKRFYYLASWGDTKYGFGHRKRAHYGDLLTVDLRSGRVERTKSGIPHDVPGRVVEYAIIPR